MYAAASFQLGRATSIGGAADFARVWMWIGVAIWGLTAAGGARALIAATPSSSD
jgi:hypothetical protein